MKRWSAGQSRDQALRRIEIFHRCGQDFILEGTRATQERWHHQKYFTWVQQQGKSEEALDRLKSQDFWAEQRHRAGDIDRLLEEIRSQV